LSHPNLAFWKLWRQSARNIMTKKKPCAKKSCGKSCKNKSYPSNKDTLKKCNDSLPNLDSVVIEKEPESLWSRIKKLFGYA
jgi:murein L,D-transpeptidase YafK